MDTFFTQQFCDRCGADLKNGRIMSMYNEDCICMACKEKQKQRDDYADAVKKDIAEYKARHHLAQQKHFFHKKQKRQVILPFCMH